MQKDINISHNKEILKQITYLCSVKILILFLGIRMWAEEFKLLVFQDSFINMKTHTL